MLKPTDLGGKAPGLCGKFPNQTTGWIEGDPQKNFRRCGKCCELIVDAIGSI